jgi:hypothetical protein
MQLPLSLRQPSLPLPLRLLLLPLLLLILPNPLLPLLPLQPLQPLQPLMLLMTMFRTEHLLHTCDIKVFSKCSPAHLLQPKRARLRRGARRLARLLV